MPKNYVQLSRLPSLFLTSIFFIFSVFATNSVDRIFFIIDIIMAGSESCRVSYFCHRALDLSTLENKERRDYKFQVHYPIRQ